MLSIIVPISVPALIRTIFTVDPGLPVYLHETVCDVFRCHVSPPFGAVTVMEEVVDVEVVAGVRVKYVLLVSVTVGMLMLCTLTLKSLPVTNVAVGLIDQV